MKLSFAYSGKVQCHRYNYFITVHVGNLNGIDKFSFDLIKFKTASKFAENYIYYTFEELGEGTYVRGLCCCNQNYSISLENSPLQEII